ncbi:hypothetical protein DOY81_002475 [Sarcophaga bullata]|nr:hypothetical protein DOY81_002475 [Sarcophaga bullata]
MKSSVVLFKIDEKALESKSELDAVYFTKPRLVAYCYKRKYNVKSMNYFKRPKPQDYPINLNAPKSNKLKFIRDEDLQPVLKYAMSPMFTRNFENLEKIKIFIPRWCLRNIMSCYYRKKRTQETIRVSRYNNDLYMLFGNENYYSAWMTNKKCQQQSRHHYEFRNKVFSESLYYNPNKNERTDHDYAEFIRAFWRI